MLHSKSALRKSELLWTLHWFANRRNADDGSAGPAPPAAVGASEDDTGRVIQHMVSLKGEGVHRNADQQTAFSLFQDGRASAAAWTTGKVCVQLGKEGQSSPGLTTEPAKVGIQHWYLFWTYKKWGQKWLRLKVENKSQELQSTLQEDEEEQEAGTEEELQELSWEAAELCTVICNVNQKYTRISN